MSTTSQPPSGTNLPFQQTHTAGKEHPCPNCGHCPTCGKNNRPPNYWTPNQWPYVQPPRWTNSQPHWFYSSSSQGNTAA